MSEEKKLQNVRIVDYGGAFLIVVDGLIVAHFNSLGDAWRHIEWIYRISSQRFTVGVKEVPVTVGVKEVPVTEWITRMKQAGYLE